MRENVASAERDDDPQFAQFIIANLFATSANRAKWAAVDWKRDHESHRRESRAQGVPIRRTDSLNGDGAGGLARLAHFDSLIHSQKRRQLWFLNFISLFDIDNEQNELFYLLVDFPYFLFNLSAFSRIYN